MTSEAQRIHWFKLHLAAYAAMAVVLLLINLVVDGGITWAVFFVVAWGAPLAIHCAYAMRLFGSQPK
jgi:hypothetical protein